MNTCGLDDRDRFSFGDLFTEASSNSADCCNSDATMELLLRKCEYNLVNMARTYCLCSSMSVCMYLVRGASAVRTPSHISPCVAVICLLLTSVSVKIIL